jgi:soluble lytic murein transglycosylase-like protein
MLCGCAREEWSYVRWPVGHFPGPYSERLLAPMSPPPQSQPVDSPYAPLVPVWAGDAGMPFARAVQRAANYYQLPQPLVWAVIKAESNFRMDAQSPAGAQGLMQLMPGTADAMGVADSFDPDQNILGGARYLRYLANRFGGDLRLTVAAYNAGPGAVKRHGGVPPYRETRTYLERVLHFYAESHAPVLTQARR